MNAKVAIKSESITSFGGIFYVMDEFDKILCRKIDSELGMRCKYYGYQIVRYSAHYSQYIYVVAIA